MSKKITILLFFILSSIFDGYCQTYYYKLTKKIDGTNVYSNTGGGQFVTFSDKTCFESTKTGVSVGNGIMIQNRIVNGNIIYRGSSYFGDNSEFKFSSDKSVLNVSPGNGIIYVYHRTQPERDVTTCTLIRKTDSSTTSENSQPSNPSSGGTTYIPAVPNINNSINNSSSSSNQEDKARWETYYRNSYADWERRVQSTYNTIVDYKRKDSNNGSTSHNSFGIYTSSMISTFHQEQQEMRKVRQEAQTKGIQISPSSWETATISVY